MLEMRRLPRLPIEKAGMMAFEDGTTYPCLVTNISRYGAKILLLRSQELPLEFSLSVDGSKSRVRPVWRTRFHVGVQFVTASPVQAAMS